MSNFIYALTESDRDVLLTKGFKLIGTRKMSGQNAYLFENQPDKAFFNEVDKKKFLFSNKAFF